MQKLPARVKEFSWLLHLPTRFGTCSLHAGDGWSTQAPDTRLHPFIPLSL